MHSSLKLKFVPFASLCMCDFSLKMKLLTPFAKHPICHTSPRSFTVKINWDDFRPNSTISDHILPLTLNLFQSLTGCSKKLPQAAQLLSLLISRLDITIPSITSLFSFCGNLIACLSDSCVKMVCNYISSALIMTVIKRPKRKQISQKEQKRTFFISSLCRLHYIVK